MLAGKPYCLVFFDQCEGKDDRELRERTMVPSTITERGEASRSRRHVIGQRKFTHDDDLCLIAFWEENYEAYEKGSKLAFAKRAMSVINNATIEGSANVFPATKKQIHNKLMYLNRKYNEVYDRYSALGKGFDEISAGPIKDTILRQFPYFFRLHSFMKPTKASPPGIQLQSSSNIQTSVFPDEGRSDEHEIEATDESDKADDDGVGEASVSRKRFREVMENRQIGSIPRRDRLEGVKAIPDEVQCKCSVEDRLKELEAVRAPSPKDNWDTTTKSADFEMKTGEIAVKREEITRKWKIGRVDQLRQLAIVYIQMNMRAEAVDCLEKARTILDEDN